jgi:formylglycine-generating enzyme required for sulfatase activity
MRPLALVALLWIGCAAVGPVVRADEPGPRPRDLAELEPARLVARWLAASGEHRPLFDAELRRRGPAVVPALRGVGAEATPVQRARAGRLLAQIRDDWARRNTPEGMVYVPAGPVEVPRASAPWGPTGTRRVVAAFYVDRTEVTVAAWRAWLATLRAQGAAGERYARALWHPPADMPADMPVVAVSWAEAGRHAAEARAGRLPTADEFERALRGSGVATWPWGGEVRSEHANLRGLGPGRPEPVGSYPKGASAFGVLDLIGNVAEWSATEVTQGRGGRYPLVLGGSFHDAPSDALAWRGLDRMAARTSARARQEWLGFRVARDVPPLPE